MGARSYPYRECTEQAPYADNTITSRTQVFQNRTPMAISAARGRQSGPGPGLVAVKASQCGEVNLLARIVSLPSLKPSYKAAVALQSWVRQS